MICTIWMRTGAGAQCSVFTECRASHLMMNITFYWFRVPFHQKHHTFNHYYCIIVFFYIWGWRFHCVVVFSSPICIVSCVSFHFHKLLFRPLLQNYSVQITYRILTVYTILNSIFRYKQFCWYAVHTFWFLASNETFSNKYLPQMSPCAKFTLNGIVSDTLARYICLYGITYILHTPFTIAI